jgi:hypothetical protein
VGAGAAAGPCRLKAGQRGKAAQVAPNSHMMCGTRNPMHPNIVSGPPPPPRVQVAVVQIIIELSTRRGKGAGRAAAAAAVGPRPRRQCTPL